MIHWAAEGNSDLLKMVSTFGGLGNINLYRHLWHEIYSKETMILACRMGRAIVIDFLLGEYNLIC